MAHSSFPIIKTDSGLKYMTLISYKWEISHFVWKNVTHIICHYQHFHIYFFI